MATASTEERELALVNKVEMRIALANTDDKLAGLLKTFLAPLLLKLTSEHISVRNKVISICQHISKRIIAPSIQLPVAALLKQFKENPDSKLLRHFDILYIQQGVTRLPPREQGDLLPVLVKGVSQVLAQSDQNGAHWFSLILRALQHYKLPLKGTKEDQELRKVLELEDEDAKALSTWFGKLILFTNVRRSAADNATNAKLPGLSDSDYEFLSRYGKPDTWDPNSESGLLLSSTKVNALQFLASGAFNDEERFLPALFASADSNSVIADRGEDILKRAISNINVEDKSLVAHLYDIYLGTSAGNAVTPSLQIKILSLLSRSLVSTAFPAQFSQIVVRGLKTDSTVRGREAQKLHSAIFSFANFYLRHAKTQELSSVTSPLTEQLSGFIALQGWPSPEANADLGLRRHAYELIGLAAKASQTTDLNLLDWLFQSLSEDASGKETAVSIEEGLSSLIGAFSNIFGPTKSSSHSDTEDVEMKDSGTSFSEKDLHNLAKLLLRYMEEPPTSPDATYRRSTRYVAVRFANRCLPYSNVVGRWINILAVGGAPGENHEVAEEGKKGLNPYWFRMLNTDRPALWQKASASLESQEIEFPNFTDLFKIVFPQIPLHSGCAPEDVIRGVESFMQQHPSAFAPALNYSRRVFINKALEHSHISLGVDVDWERKVESASSNDTNTRNGIKKYIMSLAKKPTSARAGFALAGLMRAALEALTWDRGTGIEGVQDIFTNLLTVCPAEFINHFQFPSSYNSLTPSLKSNHEHIRSTAARSFGILASYQNDNSVPDALTKLVQTAQSWRSSVGSSINEVHGKIKAVAFAISRIYYRGVFDESYKGPLESLQEIVVNILVDSSDSTLLDAAYSAIEQLSIFSVYGKNLQVDAKILKSMVEKISDRAQSGNERAITALGRLAVCLSDESNEQSALEYLDEKIYKLHDIRQMEAQFAVGEALCCLAGGWECTALQLELDMDGKRPSSERMETPLKVLERTIKDCKASKPSLRKASVIWLLCLVQFCGHLPEIQTQLRACQAAFKHCLTDRDELVQEAASRGLGLVYEKGDRDLKDDLVRDLVGSFSENKANLAGNVTDDTQLFEPGALPTGDGSVTTYKDILSLASEVGDASLVYRFMGLAANNAIWSSRAAFGRFGLSNVFSDSSVDGYLAENPKLYPKLYRYRFDPNTNVQRSMNDIWNALVKDSNATIEKNFDAIMEDLLQNILTKEWRVRQACCAAIADLVQGRQFSSYEKYLSEIWSLCFKVMDDIKDSVRVAAASLARVLTAILVRSLEAGDSSTKSADGMLKNVLPFLLSSSGLESSASDVQSFALHTLLQIIKKGSGKILRPFIPELIERMLGLLSALEPEAVNYLHLNAAKYNLTEEKIDNVRLNSIRSSPMMEAIERCLDLVDDETMEGTAPAIEKAMKTAVGLPSKVGCSRVLVSLSTRHRGLYRPYADHFLKLIEKYGLDRNDTVSSSYAAAGGYTARVASDKQILQLIAFAKNLYLTSEDERHRAVAADIIHAISKHATERFANLAVDILPFVFVAKYDGQEDVKDLCETTWGDNVGGSRAVSLYLKEIMALALQLLDSPRWNLKHAAARAVAAATDALASGIDGIPKDQAEILWPTLRKALEGKTWDGKEVVVQAFARFAETIRKDAFCEKITPEVIKIVLREARRQNKVYQQFSIPALGRIAAAFITVDSIDWNKEVFEIVTPLVEDLTSTDEDAMDVDAGNGKRNDRVRDKTLSGAVDALQRSFNADQIFRKSGHLDVQKRVLGFLDLASNANKARSNEVYTASFEAMEAFFKKIDQKVIEGVDAPGLDTIPDKFGEIARTLLFQANYNGLNEAIRLQRAKAVVAFASIPWKPVVQSALKHDSGLDKDIAEERAPSVRQILEEARAKTK